jgi:hypothetical protein
MFFSLLTLLAWLRWIESGRHWNRYYAATAAGFGLALLSKESAVAVVPLLILMARAEGISWRATLRATLPFVSVAVVYAGLIFAAQGDHLHFHDGTFTLGAPVVMNLMNSMARLFWIWGVASLVVLLLLKSERPARLLGVAGCWIVITLLPYSFLSYMPHVPSRHMYFASIGVGWIVAAGFLKFWEWWNPSSKWAAAALATLIIAHNCSYVWTKKQQQFLRRAAPNTALIEFATSSEGPFRVKCFPFGREAAMAAIAIGSPDRLSTAVWDPDAPSDAPDVFCDRSRP